MFYLLNTKARLFQAICLGVAVCFLLTGIMPSQAFAQHLGASPALNTAPLSPAFTPTLVRGIRVYPDNPFTFDFIVDSGDTGLTGDALKKESEKLIRYFLASLTIPENNLWVNLSPYEKDRIIPDTLGTTEMGHDMLAQDYLLKQITASLTNPESDLGKQFWDRVYKKAYEKFGTTNIPVDTFNKVWIMPDKAEVYENGDKAFVVESRLKVMLEEDYIALAKNETMLQDPSGSLAKEKSSSSAARSENSASAFSSQAVREVFIPALEKEVNEGKNFAQLRQIYNTIILGYWYKTKLKNSILNQTYSDQQKTKGIDFSGKGQTQAIYERYLETFKKGVCNMMKVEYDPYTHKTIPRKYFAGGVTTADVGKVFKSSGNPSACSPLIEMTKDSTIISVTAGFNPLGTEKPSQAASPIQSPEIPVALAGAGTENFSGQLPSIDQQRNFNKRFGASSTIKPTESELEQALSVLRENKFFERSQGFLDRLLDLDPRNSEKNWAEEVAERLGDDLYDFATEIRQMLGRDPSWGFLYTTLNVGGPFSEKLDVINPLSGVSMSLRNPDREFVEENFDVLQISLKKVRDVFKALAENSYDVGDVKLWSQEKGFYLDVFRQGVSSSVVESKISSLEEWKSVPIFVDGKEYELIATSTFGNDRQWQLRFFNPRNKQYSSRVCSFDIFKMQDWIEGKGSQEKILFDNFRFGFDGLYWSESLDDASVHDARTNIEANFRAIFRKHFDREKANANDFVDVTKGKREDLSYTDIGTQVMYWLRKQQIIEPGDLLEGNIALKKGSALSDHLSIDEALNAFSLQLPGSQEIYLLPRKEKLTYVRALTDEESEVTLDEFINLLIFGSKKGSAGYDSKAIVNYIYDPGEEYFLGGKDAIEFAARFGTLLNVVRRIIEAHGSGVNKEKNALLAADEQFALASREFFYKHAIDRATGKLWSVQDAASGGMDFDGFTEMVPFSPSLSFQLQIKDKKGSSSSIEALRAKSSSFVSDQEVFDLWDNLQNEYILYHGTSVNNVDSIRKKGLNIDDKPFENDDIATYERLYKKATGREVPLPERYNSGVIHLTTHISSARDYALNGPEILRMMLDRIPKLLDEGNLALTERAELKRIQDKYSPFLKAHDEYLKTHSPYILKIKGSALRKSAKILFYNKENFLNGFRETERNYFIKENEALSLEEFKHLLLLEMTDVRVSDVSLDEISFPEDLARASISSASDQYSSGTTKGGIDFNAENINMQAKGNGADFSLPAQGIDGMPMNIQGLTPVILRVVPVADFMGLLGLSQEEQKAMEQQLSQDDSSYESGSPSQDPDIPEVAFCPQGRSSL